MSVAAIIAALQARLGAISGIATAPTLRPESVPESECPCAIVDPLDGDTGWDAHGGDLAIEERAYLIRVLVAPTGVGIVGEVSDAAVALLDAVLADLRGTPDLTATAAVRIEKGLRDTGVRPAASAGPLVYGLNTFVGFEVRVPIEERWES